MSKNYYATYLVNGAINAEVIGSKFISPENEKRFVQGVYLQVSAQEGNTINLYLEREKIAEITDYIIPTTAGVYNIFFPLNLQLPVGQSLTLSVQAGGTANNLRAVYLYNTGG